MSSEWILCEDRLPDRHEVGAEDEKWEESDDVLVCGINAYGEVGCALSQYIFDREHGFIGWYAPYDNYGVKLEKIIAWTPIPTLPPEVTK